MVEQEDDLQAQAPSKKAIAKATGIALAVALVLLFTAVLPAEYGIDPLKTGKLLHLTDLAKATESKAESKPVGARPVAAPAGIYTAQPGIFKTDSEDLSLMPGQQAEQGLLRKLRTQRSGRLGPFERLVHRALNRHPRLVLGKQGQEGSADSSGHRRILQQREDVGR
jgi:hypothetical protein